MSGPDEESTRMEGAARPAADAEQGDGGPASETDPRKHSSRPPSAVSLQPGTVVGRYVIVQPLGRGGMSEVMLAHDTQLQRNVAIKVLLTHVASEAGRLRMMREAQAMAQLSHPNVVAIFDVGTHEGNIYLAMEYIDGETLHHWLKSPRSRREILSVMRQAGRGLAAAHAAGIVHRDFKPANVVIAKDGRTRVLDFGIARSAGRSAPESTPQLPSDPSEDTSGPQSMPPRSLPPFEWEPPSSATDLATLTEEGMVVGTVGYFAPETVFEHQVDARSDVFSFCVTLWRALYGIAPFPTHSIDGYLQAVHKAAVRRPPRTRLPAWLEEAIRKGLHDDPSRRHASMEELLRALDADPWRARIARGAALVAVIGAAATVLGVVRHRHAVRAACVAEGRALAERWEGAPRDSVREAMLAAGDAFAPARTERALAVLDRYAGEWSNAQQSSCEATHVIGTQTAAAHEERTGCLLAARQQFDVVAELLGQRGSLVQKRALEVVSSLPPLRLCSGRDVENAFVPLPAEPGPRSEAQQGRELTVRARALLSSGMPQEALVAATQARELAQRAGVAADAASAVLVIATAQNRMARDAEARQTALDAFLVAERAGADRVAGFAAAQVASVLSHRSSQMPEARSWLDVARAKLARLGGDDELELSFLGTAVVVESNDHQIDRALDDSKKLIERESALYGRDSHKVCGAIYNRSLTLVQVPDAQGAAAELRQALACFEKVTAPTDPWLGVVHGALADALLRAGSLDEAREELQRTMDLRKPLGPKDQILGAVLTQLAVIEEEQGRPADAESHARRALDIAEGQSGWIADQVPNMLFALGMARLDQGDARGAREQCARGVAVLEQVAPPAPDKVYEGDVLRCLGETELALGDVADARAHLERSVSLPLRWQAGDLQLARRALDRARAAKPPAHEYGDR